MYTDPGSRLAPSCANEAVVAAVNFATPNGPAEVSLCSSASVSIAIVCIYVGGVNVEAAAVPGLPYTTPATSALPVANRLAVLSSSHSYIVSFDLLANC